MKERREEKAVPDFDMFVTLVLRRVYFGGIVSARDRRAAIERLQGIIEGLIEEGTPLPSMIWELGAEVIELEEIDAEERR